MTGWEAFWFGVAGSMAVEIVSVLQAYRSPAHRLPLQYEKPGFWIARFLMLFVAGGLAAITDAHSPLAAAATGASADLLVEKLQRGGG